MAISPHVIEAFGAEYYASGVWERGRTTFCGLPIAKLPLDLHVYHEVIFRARPHAIIETGTWYGASALFFAYQMMIATTEGIVITIDREPYMGPPLPKVVHVQGDSVDPDVVEAVRQHLAAHGAERVMVVLDSDHHGAHVAEELRRYAPFVTPEQYLVVEDTNIQYRDGAPGPAAAVEAFLLSDLGHVFRRDAGCEKFGLTFAPGGWLQREA